MDFLRKVSIFQNLSEDRISKLADVMDQDYYAGGHYILREGEKGGTFFVINSGQVILIVDSVSLRNSLNYY